MRRGLAILTIFFACGDDGTPSGADGADAGGDTSAAGDCALTAVMQQAGTPGAMSVTALGTVTCTSPHDLALAVTLQWKSAGDPDSAWSEVQTSTQSASARTELSAAPAAGILCPLHANKEWRAVASASVDGVALAGQTSSVLSGLCP